MIIDSNFLSEEQFAVTVDRILPSENQVLRLGEKRTNTDNLKISCVWQHQSFMLPKQPSSCETASNL